MLVARRGDEQVTKQAFEVGGMERAISVLVTGRQTTGERGDGRRRRGVDARGSVRWRAQG